MSTPPAIRRSIEVPDLTSLDLDTLRRLAHANGVIPFGPTFHKKSYIDPILSHARSSSDGKIIVPSSDSQLFVPHEDSRKRKRTEMESAPPLTDALTASGSGAEQSTPDERHPKRRRISPTTTSSNSRSPSTAAAPSTQVSSSSFSILTFANFVLRTLLRPPQLSGDTDQMEYICADSAEGKQLDEFVGSLLTSRGESDELKIEKLWCGIRDRLAASGMDRLVQKWNVFRLIIQKFVIPGVVSFDDAKADFRNGLESLEVRMCGLIDKRARKAAVEFLKEHRVSQYRKKKKVKAGESDGKDDDDDVEEGEIADQIVGSETLRMHAKALRSIVRNRYGVSSGRIRFSLEDVGKATVPSVETFTWTPFSVVLERVGYDPEHVILHFGRRLVRVDETPEEIGLTESSKLEVIRRIKIRVCGSNGSLCFLVNPYSGFGSLFAAYRKHTGMCCDFLFGGSRINASDTPMSFHMKDGDVIDAQVEQVGGKPVVLLYPPSHADSLSVLSVRVHLNSEKWKVLAYYPQTEPMVDPYTVQWRSLVVESNGNITTHSDPSPSVHQYLFWESLVLPSTSPFDFEASRPVYAVPSGQVCPFLLRLLLNQMRMKQRDAHNLITYWLKDLMTFPFILLQLMSSEVYESLVELTIDPRPDVFIRVFLLFCGCSDLSTVVREPNVESDLSGVLSLPAVESLGDLPSKYICYEWGGMNLHASRLIQRPSLAGRAVL